MMDKSAALEAKLEKLQGDLSSLKGTSGQTQVWGKRQGREGSVEGGSVCVCAWATERDMRKGRESG